MQATAYAPSLGAVIKKKGDNHNNAKSSPPCRMYARKRQKKTLNEEEFALGQWIDKLVTWLQENGGSRSRSEIIQRAAHEGLTLKQFQNRTGPYEWLSWDTNAQNLKILSEEEVNQIFFNDRFHEKATELFQRRPRTKGDWVPVNTIKAKDWVWVSFPHNSDPLYTTYLEVAEDGVLPTGKKSVALIIDGHIFKRTSRPRTK